jgi:hypothetical protein
LLRKRPKGFLLRRRPEELSKCVTRFKPPPISANRLTSKQHSKADIHQHEPTCVESVGPFDKLLKCTFCLRWRFIPEREVRG